MGKVHANHGRDHLPGGTDPIPLTAAGTVDMRPPYQYGRVIPGIRLRAGCGVTTAPLVVPDNTFESVTWEAGEVITIDWNHVSWYSLHRAARIHLVEDGTLSTTSYNRATPWSSSPYDGGSFTGGTSLNSQTYSGLYCLIAATNVESGAISWAGSGGLTLSVSEQFSFATSGAPANKGRVAYAFTTISGTGIITITAAGSPTEKWWGYNKLAVASGSPVFSTIIAEDTDSGSAQEISTTLDYDVAAGSQIVPVAFYAPPGATISTYDQGSSGANALEWPLIRNSTRENAATPLLPYQVYSDATYGVNYYPLERHIGGGADIGTT